MKRYLENHPVLLRKGDWSVFVGFLHRKSIQEKEQERISYEQTEIKKLLPLAHARNQFSRCFSEQHSPEHIPYLQGHSSGNTTCVTPGKFFCSFQLRMHAPVFPEKGSKAEELWLNKNTYLILPAAGKQSFSKVIICIDTLKPQSLVLLPFQGKQQSRKPRT